MTEIEEAVARVERQIGEALTKGSPTAYVNVGDYETILSALSASQAEVERLTRERDEAKSRGDNHWQTLRSIREMAREGDTDRIILWVNDAGSGHTEGAEQTLKTVSDQRNAAEARATRAEGLLAEAGEVLGPFAEIAKMGSASSNMPLAFLAARAFLDKLKEQGQ